MVVTIGSYKLEHRQWSNKIQLREYLAKRCRKYAILGKNIEDTQEFFSVIIQAAEPPLDNSGVGICSMVIGLQPEIYLQPQNRILLVGFNSTVYGVDLLDSTVAFCHELNSPFYYFAPVSMPPRILVQHEVGIVMLTEEGEVLWKFDGDIITGLQYYDNKLELQFMDTSPISLELESGKPLMT